jgi:hypothetical protein
MVRKKNRSIVVGLKKIRTMLAYVKKTAIMLIDVIFLYIFNF